MAENGSEQAGSARGWLRRNVGVRDVLTLGLILVLVLNFIASAFNAYYARLGARSAQNNNRILRERDFNRLYSEHAETRALICAAHPEIKAECERGR